MLGDWSEGSRNNTNRGTTKQKYGLRLLLAAPVMLIYSQSQDLHQRVCDGGLLKNFVARMLEICLASAIGFQESFRSCRTELGSNQAVDTR